jgi:hypothetical protein
MVLGDVFGGMNGMKFFTSHGIERRVSECLLGYLKDQATLFTSQHWIGSFIHICSFISAI